MSRWGLFPCFEAWRKRGRARDAACASATAVAGNGGRFGSQCWGCSNPPAVAASCAPSLVLTPEEKNPRGKAPFVPGRWHSSGAALVEEEGAGRAFGLQELARDLSESKTDGGHPQREGKERGWGIAAALLIPVSSQPGWITSSPQMGTG